MEVEAVYEAEGGPLLWFQAIGHVDKVQFAAGLHEQYRLIADPEHIHHTYRRCVPDRELGQPVCNIWYRRGPGAQPVTVVEADTVRDRREALEGKGDAG